MRKTRLIMVLSVVLALFAVTVHAAAPNIVGTWKGKTKKLSIAADSKCVSLNATFVVEYQCGNLFRGTLTVGGTTVNMLGSFDTSSTFSAISQYSIEGAMVNFLANVKGNTITSSYFDIITASPTAEVYDKLVLKKQ